MNICERLQAYRDPGMIRIPHLLFSQKYNILFISLPTNMQRIPWRDLHTFHLYKAILPCFFT